MNLRSEAQRRRNHYMAWTQMANTLHLARNSALPLETFQEFQRYEINKVRSAHDTHVSIAAKTFGLNVAPLNPKATDRAAQVENICRGYNEAAKRKLRVPHDKLKYWETWWLALTGESVRLVLPDYERKTPYFTTVDPRTHLPPVGYNPLMGPLPNSMLVTTERIDTLANAYPAHAPRLLNLNRDGHGPDTGTLIRYFSADEWIAEFCYGDDDITLFRSQTGDPFHPGVNPVIATWTWDGMSKGRPLLADVLDLQKVSTVILSMTLESIEQMLYPAIFHDPVVGGNIKRGYGETNEFDAAFLQGRGGRVEKLAPESPINGLQLMSFLGTEVEGLARNPEAFAGQGEADSAKALTEIKSGPQAWVKTHIWGAQLASEAISYSTAMTMDRKLWGNESKQIPGSKKSYRPNIVLDGYEDCVEMLPGHGIGGHMGEIQRIQKVQAGLMTRLEAAEEDPSVTDARAHIKALDLERIKELNVSLLQAKSQDPNIGWDTFTKIQKVMEDEDLDISQAITKLSERGELGPPSGSVQPSPPDLSALLNLGGGQDALAQGATEPPALAQLRSA